MNNIYTVLPKETYYVIHITENFQVHLNGKMPNWFRRKMMYIFFGFKVKKLEREE